MLHFNRLSPQNQKNTLDSLNSSGIFEIKSNFFPPQKLSAYENTS